MIIYKITIPDRALDGFASAVRASLGAVQGQDVESGLAGMFANMESEELRELASSLLTLANGLERGAPEPAAPDRGQVSDGYHTFDELYEHRRALTAVLAAGASGQDSWRSKAHHPDNDTIFEGYFIVGIELPTGTITYHYKLEHWDDFAAVPELEHAPKWDGATPADTVTRLLKLARFAGGVEL